MADTFQPFANDDQSVMIGDLTIENGQQQIAIYGELNLVKGDKTSFEQASALAKQLTAILAQFEAQG